MASPPVCRTRYRRTTTGSSAASEISRVNSYGNRHPARRARDHAALRVLVDPRLPARGPELAVIGERRGAVRSTGNPGGEDRREALVPAAAVGGLDIGAAGHTRLVGDGGIAPEPLAAPAPAQVGDLHPERRRHDELEFGVGQRHGGDPAEAELANGHGMRRCRERPKLAPRVGVTLAVERAGLGDDAVAVAAEGDVDDADRETCSGYSLATTVSVTPLNEAPVPGPAEDMDGMRGQLGKRALDRRAESAPGEPALDSLPSPTLIPQQRTPPPSAIPQLVYQLTATSENLYPGTGCTGAL